jgi:hypothetical protein
VIDIHSHILPGLMTAPQPGRLSPDGLAGGGDGTHTMVQSSPIQNRSVNLAEINHRDEILNKIAEFNDWTAAIDLETGL